MKKILLVILTLLSVVVYSQNPYPTKVKISNDKTYATAYGALAVKGPIIFPATDTLSSLVGDPLYLGATIYKDNTLYINNGSYWQPLNPDLAIGFPGRVVRGNGVDTLLFKASPGAVIFADIDSNLAESQDFVFTPDSLHINRDLYLTKLTDGSATSKILTIDQSTGLVSSYVLPISHFANGLVSTNGVNLSGSALTITGPITWRFNNAIYTDAVDKLYTINDASENSFRTDVIWIDSTGAFKKTLGIEDTTKTIQPIIDYNGVLVAIVDIHGSVKTTNGGTTTLDYWALTGNTFGSSAATFGSKDLKPIDFITANTKRMTLTETGELRFNVFNNQSANIITVPNSVDPSINSFSVEANSTFGRLILNANNAGYISGGLRFVKHPTTDTISDGAYCGLLMKFYDKLMFNSTSAQDQAFEFKSAGNNQFTIGSQTKPGITIAKISTATRDIIVSPNTGVLIYNTTTNTFNYYDGSAWVDLSSGGGGGGGTPGWNLTGNSGTTAGTNFIGTTDAVNFVIKVNNTQAVKFYGDGTGNIDLGLGTSSITGFGSTAFGINNNVGAGGTAFGYSTTATGSQAFSSGTQNKATGAYSFSANNGGEARGSNSAKFGAGGIAKSIYEFVLGSFPDTTNSGNATTFNSSDRLFTIGNGSTTNLRSNAVTVLKNGNFGISTLTPTAKLHVNGSVRFEGLGEANGKVLTSDANGNASWQASAGGSSTTFVYGERFTGSTSTTITTAHSYTTNTIRVYKNGVRLDPTTDYTQATSTTITLSNSRLSGDVFLIDYNY